LRIGHVAVSVSDLDRSISFYRDNFGFECAEKIHKDEEDVFEICILKKDGIVLELFCFPGFNPLPEYRRYLKSDIRTLGVKHFAFEVSDARKKYEELKDRGIELVTDIEVLDNGMKYFFIKDTDGIFIEIIENNG